MRKLLFTLFIIISCSTNAQYLLSYKFITDRFNDPVLGKTPQKTLIEINDSMVIVEEKGKEPVPYALIPYNNGESYVCNGTKENMVEFSYGVHGYATEYLVGTMEDGKPVLYGMEHRIISSSPVTFKYECEMFRFHKMVDGKFTREAIWYTSD